MYLMFFGSLFFLSLSYYILTYLKYTLNSLYKQIAKYFNSLFDFLTIDRIDQVFEFVEFSDRIDELVDNEWIYD
jgi:hypothetical protein